MRSYWLTRLFIGSHYGLIGRPVRVRKPNDVVSERGTKTNFLKETQEYG